MSAASSTPPPDSSASTDAPAASPAGAPAPSGPGMLDLVLDLVRPYRGWLSIVFVAMVFETAMSLAAPWPLKVIIDNVVGHHKLPEWLHWLRDFSLGEHTLALAGVAAAAAVVIAIIGAVAGYPLPHS